MIKKKCKHKNSEISTLKHFGKDTEGAYYVIKKQLKCKDCDEILETLSTKISRELG